MSINKYVRGARANIPSGYILGRASKGSGRVELIKVAGLTAGGGGISSSSGGGTGGGGGGGGSIGCLPVVAAPFGLLITDEACGTCFTNEA